MWLSDIGIKTCPHCDGRVIPIHDGLLFERIAETLDELDFFRCERCGSEWYPPKTISHIDILNLWNRRKEKEMENKDVKSENVSLSSPWMIYYHQLEAIFNGDEQVKMRFDNNAVAAYLYVDDLEKAEAIETILPSSVQFGNVTMKIVVFKPNGAKTEVVDLFKKAFEGNKAVSSIKTIKTPDGTDMNFVVFKPEVKQYFADQLCSPWGLESALYEDLAYAVFDCWNGEIHFCTEPIEGINKITIK